MSSANTQQDQSSKLSQSPDAEKPNQNVADKSQINTQPKKKVQPYIGLPNQGATCYMNSLLQTLFMTPEFRSALYSWKYDEKKDAKPEDCIPLQLQKLFASLQLKHTGSVSTKPLTKSFQWEEATSFEQHDIQEFSSVLFDAINESMKTVQSDTFLNDIYEGTIVSYVKCLECGYESSRPENFLNIGLTVKNEFDKIYNDNLRRALQLYLKPEKLEGSNQYFCEVCNKKVDAIRGTKFVKVPKLLNVIINRFSFDFIYMRRVKLDDFFEFPFILNMNDYINGYEGIKNKVSESSSPEFFNEYKRKRDAERASAVKLAKQAEELSADNKKPVRSEVRSFIADLKKRGEQNKQNSIDVVIYTKDLDGNSAETGQAQEDDSNPDIKKIDIRHVPDKVEESKVNPEDIKTKEDRDIKRAEERQQLINEYLKDGPLVYELYSILIHSGGAYGGHYYAYIKSSEDWKWYNFNDTTVSEMDPNDIPDKTFGGGKSANAYMLIYRQVESDQEEKIVIEDNAIPQYLKKFIEEESKKLHEIETQRLEKLKNMNLRIYHGSEVKILPAHADEKFRDFELKALNLFGIQEKSNNVRVRLYHPLTETMQDTYTGKEDYSLGELKISSSKSLRIEIKKDNEEFEEYKADSKCFRIALWREHLPDLTEASLRPQKVLVPKDGILQDLLEGISKKFDIPVEQIRLIKKTQIGGFPTAVLINIPENVGLRYNEAKIFEGIVLYVERSEVPEALLWKEEFDKDAYNYKIKFNSPYVEGSEIPGEETNFVLIDARKSLQELKAEICKNLNLNEEEVILRKGGRAGTEIKDMRQTVLSANFINGSSVFVEFGKPAVAGELRIFVTLALKNDDDDFDDILTHEFEELGEFIISGENSAQDVKEKIAEHVKKHKNLDWDTKKMRLRERVANRLVRVYRNLPLQNQGVCDKKQVSIELLDNPEALAPKENLVICRMWNPELFELGAPFEVIVDRNKSLKNFAEKIFQQNQTVEIENMMGIKIPAAWEFVKYDLVFQEWVNLNDEDKLVYNEPLYLNIDGTNIFIKDKNMKDKELTEEEKKNIGISRVQNRSGEGYSAKGGEKSLKIHVKKKEINNEGEDNQSTQLGGQEDNSTQEKI